MARGVLLAAALALSAGSRAQETAPPAAEAPPLSAPPAADATASTAAVAASTEAVAASTAPAGGDAAPHKPVAVSLEEGKAGYLPEDAPKPPPPLQRPLRVKVHKEAKEWTPVAVRFGGDPEQLATAVTRRVMIARIKGKRVERGERSKASAAARVYKAGEDRLIVVSLYPEALKKLRTHLEVRLKIIEGYLEGAQVAAVLVDDPGAAWGKEDSVTLRRKSLPFREEYPSAAEMRVSAVDPGPGKHSANGASVRHAEFGGRELGFVNFSYFLRGVAAGDASLLPPPKPKRARRRR